MEGPIGFIGVGAMGSAIASRLVEPFDLLITDKNPDAGAHLVEQGAKFLTTKEIAATASIVFLSLPGPPEVEDLLLGSGRLASQLGEGSVIIDTSTSSPVSDWTLRDALAERGISFADSPISGGVSRARAGTATLMVGAEPDVFERIAGILAHVTTDVFRVGPVGAGHAMKLINQLLNAANRFAAIEAVRIGRAAGLEQDTIIEVLNKSSGRNYTTENTYPQLLSGDTYKPQGFTVRLMDKDVRLANLLADSVGLSIPLGATVKELTTRAVERFGANADQSQMMAEWYED
jgi:3-hydroxyisobutyrate dehydrogenase-like beta-hydroxyacid dehydrogenase